MLPEVKWHWCWCSFETDWIEDWIDFSPKLILEIFYIFPNRMKWAKHCAFDEMTWRQNENILWCEVNFGRCFCARQNAKGQEIDKEFNKYGHVPTYFKCRLTKFNFFGRKNFWAELNWTFSYSSPLWCVWSRIISAWMTLFSFWSFIFIILHMIFSLHTLKRSLNF